MRSWDLLLLVVALARLGHGYPSPLNTQQPDLVPSQQLVTLPNGSNLDSLIADLASLGTGAEMASQRVQAFFAYIYQFTFTPTDVENLRQLLQECNTASLAMLRNNVIKPYLARYVNPAAAPHQPVATPQDYPLAYLVHTRQNEAVRCIVQALCERLLLDEKDDRDIYIWSHLLSDLMFTAALHGSLELVLYLWRLKTTIFRTLDENDFDNLMYLAARCGHADLVLGLLETVKSETEMDMSELPLFVNEIIAHTQSQPRQPWVPKQDMDMSQVHGYFNKIDFDRFQSLPFYGTFY
ncbi:hypothetical protein H4R34_003838 [Dimargaris verticillata]|uniref:Ankyrin repeat-containing domain protein n=1 Tax=Dimargaris verticillata TaxID=2761393 RepID=A0A9W8B6R4_9FUNG|nr:hypothetical protein H4R34_003838 [Dimargaris verticillata]